PLQFRPRRQESRAGSFDPLGTRCICVRRRQRATAKLSDNAGAKPILPSIATAVKAGTHGKSLGGLKRWRSKRLAMPLLSCPPAYPPTAVTSLVGSLILRINLA